MSQPTSDLSAGAVSGVPVSGVPVPMSAPVHGRTVLHDSSHPLAAFDALVGSRCPLTGCLDAASVPRLGAMLARDDDAPVGAVLLTLEGEGSAGEDAGPPEGVLRDALRVQTARFLMRHVRGSEPLIRSDDDEFLVLVPGAVLRDIERVGRRVQLSAFNKAPAALALGWAARQPGEGLEVLVGRARGARVPVPQGGRGEERRKYVQ